MPSFDWPAFLNDYQIPHQFGGKNTRADWIGVSCPLCGMEGNPDPSTHLGIDPEYGAWNCWRNPRHSGRTPERLVQAWLRCSRSAATSIVKRYSSGKPERADRLLHPQEDRQDAKESHAAVMPSTLRSLEAFPKNSAFHKYLIGRGFEAALLPRLILEYDLRAATVGPWAYRLVLPVYMRGDLVSWTGRTVAGKEPRYLNATEKDATGVVQVRECLFNFDDLLATGGDTLFLTEGPMDALKVDFYGKKFKARATCCFGLTPTETQHYLLNELRPRFKCIYILLDQKATVTSLRLRRNLSDVVDGVKHIPAEYDDPGELPKGEIRRIIHL